MDWTLEVVLIPVTDVDRAKAFYADQLGFHVDVDHHPNDSFRVVQLTPPGSACSISMGVGITDAAPGSVTHFEAGSMVAGPDPDRSDHGSYLHFRDPDGNSWAVQEVRSRATN